MTDVKTPADVLEEAADLLLIHGRCQQAGRNGRGEFCVLGAIAEAVAPDWWHGDCSAYFGEVSMPGDRGFAATSALACHLPARRGLLDREIEVVYEWNDSTDDDFEVIDTLRHVAKDLRNGSK